MVRRGAPPDVLLRICATVGEHRLLLIIVTTTTPLITPTPAHAAMTQIFYSRESWQSLSLCLSDD